MENAMKGGRSADVVLGLVFLAFIGALVLKLAFKDAFWARGLFVFTEAALVGGIADWFAVTALFKKPLGFFSWHTALIPRNRDKLIAATADMVQEKFFSQDELRKIVRKTRLTDELVGWLESPEGRAEVGAVVFPYLRKWLDGIPGDVSARWAANLERFFKKLLIDEVDLVPWVKKAADWVIANNKDAEALDGILLRAREKLDDEEAAVKGIIRRAVTAAVKEGTDNGIGGAVGGWFKRKFGEMTGAIDYTEATEVIYVALAEFVEEVSGDRGHPLRAWIRGRLEAIAAKVATDKDWRSAIGQWKKSAAEKADLREPLDTIIRLAMEEMREALAAFEAAGRAGAAAAKNPVAAWMMEKIGRYWAAFKENERLKSWVEDNVRKILYHIIDHKHDLIRKIVRDALAILSDKELNERVKRMANEDLQWIRINGSLVGGIAGLLIFLLSQGIALFR